MVRTETVLESWKSARADAAQAVLDFPEAEFDFKATPELMSFAELGRHILDAGHALTGMLLAGVDNFTGPQFRETIGKYKPQLPEKLDAATLASELRQSVETRTRELAAKDADFFAGLITRFDGERVTRLEMLQFVKEHELTHRATMFMYLRLKGIVPVTTRRRLAQQKSA